MSNPRSRRILLRGLSPEEVIARAEAYGSLYPGDEGPFALTANAPMGGWVQLDVPVELPVWHFHNLAKWFEGDAEQPGADAVMALSHGEEERWDYWLLPSPDPDHHQILSGATRSGRTLQVDVPSGRPFDRAKWQRAPMPIRLAMMSQDVHAYLHNPDRDLEAAGTVQLSLKAPPEVVWGLPEPGNLADDIELSTANEEDEGGLYNTLKGMFTRKK